MKRSLLGLGLGFALLVVVLVAAVNILAAGADGIPAPDLARPIALPDGSERSLGAILEAWQATSPAAPELLSGSESGPFVELQPSRDSSGVSDGEIVELAELALRRVSVPPDGRDPFDLAEWHRHSGHPGQAQALYLAIPENHPRWARAQRRVAWDCLSEAQDTPALGVSYAHKALAADPLDGNAWQDAARVYAATLGLPLD